MKRLGGPEPSFLEYAWFVNTLGLSGMRRNGKKMTRKGREVSRQRGEFSSRTLAMPESYQQNGEGLRVALQTSPAAHLDVMDLNGLQHFYPDNPRIDKSIKISSGDNSRLNFGFQPKDDSAGTIGIVE